MWSPGWQQIWPWKRSRSQGHGMPNINALSLILQKIRVKLKFLWQTDGQRSRACSKLMVPSERSLSQAPVFESIFYSPTSRRRTQIPWLATMRKGWLVGCGLRSHSAIFQLYLVTEMRKGLVIRNTHAKYESTNSYGKKVMCRVKVFQM